MTKKHITSKEKKDIKSFVAKRLEYIKYCAKVH